MRKPSRRWVVLAILALIPIAAAAASGRMILHKLRASDPPMELVVDLSERTLSVVRDGEVEATYGVAVGTRSHPTPTGSFRTGRIDWNPAWVPPNSEWARDLQPREPGDPANPMQGVKIYFSDLYYIHGTNDPASIGTAASHGCLRMTEGDAKSLASQIEEYGSVPMTIHK